MVDKFLNTMRWIWYSKERMVLLVVMAFLCYRIWVVFNPPQHVPDPPPQPPAKTTEGLKPELTPPMPPPRPPLKVPGNLAGLYNRNPFWYYSGSGGGATNQKDVSARDLGITLHAIREAGGTLRAQLSTASVPKGWYVQGEKFEQFEVVEINPDDRTVVVYSEQYAKRFTLQETGEGS